MFSLRLSALSLFTTQIKSLSLTGSCWSLGSWWATEGLIKLTKPLTLGLREKAAEFLALQVAHSDGRTEVEREKLKEMLRLVL